LTSASDPGFLFEFNNCDLAFQLFNYGQQLCRVGN